MLRRSLIYGIVLAVAAAVASAQPRPRAGIVPRKGAPPNKKAFERFRQMTPQQRDRAMQKLPPDRRKQMEERLDRYNELSPEERKRLDGRLDDFRQMPPEKQEAARKAVQRMNDLDAGRRPLIRREVNSWQRLSDEELKSHRASEEYRSRYSDKEREILDELFRLQRAP